ncbi:hypothetical protein [Phreatobacter sp.]|uniref:hypothetical protein n=1 Tax=Phreatobacter sp. TaxID=1966341 RepID=UPI0025D3CAD8|nr:hypothetical protein [Phreatobacter sp.]
MLRLLAACGLLLATCHPGMAAARIVALNSDMVGTWGHDPRSCTVETDNGRVEVKPLEVIFFAASCNLSGLRQGPVDALSANGRCYGEGGSFSERISLRFRQISQTRLEITFEGMSHVYQRCERALPVR